MEDYLGRDHHPIVEHSLPSNCLYSIHPGPFARCGIVFLSLSFVNAAYIGIRRIVRVWVI
jgi:hypothetical protein